MALIAIVALLIVAFLDGTQLQVATAVRLPVQGSIDPHSRLSNSERAESTEELPVVQVNNTVDVQAAPTIAMVITHGQQSEGVPRNHKNLGRFEVEGVPRNHESLPIFEDVPHAGTAEKRELCEIPSNVHQRSNFEMPPPMDETSPVTGPPGGNNGGHK
jgi:hypothetical protein